MGVVLVAVYRTLEQWESSKLNGLTTIDQLTNKSSKPAPPCSTCSGSSSRVWNTWKTASRRRMSRCPSNGAFVSHSFASFCSLFSCSRNLHPHTVPSVTSSHHLGLNTRRDTWYTWSTWCMTCRPRFFPCALLVTADLEIDPHRPKRWPL